MKSYTNRFGREIEKTLVNKLGRKLIERDIEDYYRKVIRKAGWHTEKYLSPQRRAVPDQISFILANPMHPFGITFFTELKRPGERPTELQMKDHHMRRQMGFLVFVADCYEKVDDIIVLMHDVMCSDKPIDIPTYLKH